MARSKNDEALGQAVETLAIGVWRWRLELTLVLGIVFVVLFTGLGGILVAGVLLAFISRHLLTRLHSSQVRRRWARACERSGVTPPRIRKILPIPAGDRLHVRITAKTPVATLEKHADHIASEYGRDVDVRIIRHPDAKRWATVVIMREDPFLGADPIPWPNRETTQVSFWDPIPWGVSEEGKPISLLLDTHLLVGGETGGGKSVALSIIAATAALDPHTKLWCFDAKIVELDAWTTCSERMVGPSGDDAIAVLRILNDVLDERYRELRARDGVTRKITRSDGLDQHVLIIDEMADFFDLDDKKQSDEITRLLGRLVRLGRAAGIHVVGATQKSGGDSIPTKVRDIFPKRMAFACSTPEMSDTILGAGTRTQGYDASRIAISDPDSDELTGYEGVGYLKAGRAPVYLKTYFLSDDDIQTIASKAAGQDLEAAFAMPSAGSSISMSALESAPRDPEPILSTPTRTQGVRMPPFLYGILLELPEGITREELNGALVEGGLPPFKTTIPPLLKTGDVVRSGKGVKGSPFRYRLAAPGGQHNGTGNDAQDGA